MQTTSYLGFESKLFGPPNAVRFLFYTYLIQQADRIEW